MFSDSKLLAEFRRLSKTKTVSQNTVLMNVGSEIFFVPIVIKGCLRVIREDLDGNEIFLYHLYPNQTCAMAINCCQADNKSMVKVIAEQDTELLQIPVNCVEIWLQYAEWKNFLYQTYHERFNELLQVIELIAFSNMDKQLIHYLQQRSKASQTDILHITHQQIADELRTHREAISRLLRIMEQKKQIKLSRNTIELLF